MTDPNRPDEVFKTELLGAIPYMRAFAHSLCRDRAAADDLAQDALARAWENRRSYQPGTNLKAWVAMITRNQFYSDKRRSWRQQPLDQEVAERTLVAVSNPQATLELDEVRRAMARLPEDQREALVLIGAGGLSYDEVAEICGVAVGTIKSRVSRARTRLAEILIDGDFGVDEIRPINAMGSILAELERSMSRAA